MASEMPGALGAGDEPMDCLNADMLDEEEDLVTSSSSIGDVKFDMTIGYIEDIIMEEEFQTLQTEFMEKYYNEFDDTEENKFIYTDIHKQYIELVETFLQEQLKTRMEDFTMEEFQKQLVSRKEELEGEIFEMLLTFSDFVSFKEMFLDYKADKEGMTVDLSQGLTVTSLGSGMPDLILGGGFPSKDSNNLDSPNSGEHL